MRNVYGGIEAGGTKFVCGVGNSDGEILDAETFLTEAPSLTIPKVIQYFRKIQAKYVTLTALGIASFGPIDPIKGSNTYGYIKNTPKHSWKNFNIVGAVQKELSLPIGFDTDVNGAALGEWRWGAAKGLDTFVYLTIGTGIGGGGIVNGKRLHGLSHPEMGHMRIPHDFSQDGFQGICPYHKDCFEGLASGPAIEARWGQPGEQLPNEHPAWLLESQYLALGIVNIVLTLSPQRVIIGGGVMKRKMLYPLVRKQVLTLLSGYIQFPGVSADLSDFIVEPGLRDYAGLKGAIALAMEVVH